jgi:hypothetical protein
MDLDIRIPIGLLFFVLGIILAGLGLLTLNDSGFYVRSLGHNVNLWTGLLMMVFSGLLLMFSLKGWRRQQQKQ